MPSNIPKNLENLQHITISILTVYMYYIFILVYYAYYINIRYTVREFISMNFFEIKYQTKFF